MFIQSALSLGSHSQLDTFSYELFFLTVTHAITSQKYRPFFLNHPVYLFRRGIRSVSCHACTYHTTGRDISADGVHPDQMCSIIYQKSGYVAISDNRSLGNAYMAQNCLPSCTCNKRSLAIFRTQRVCGAALRGSDREQARHTFSSARQACPLSHLPAQFYHL